MKLEDLLRFIKIENERLRKRYPDTDNEKMILAQTVKINEELGELCDEVLAHTSLQRKEKLESHDKERISEEFADVLITTLLLAETMGIDIERALEKKMEKLNERYEK